MPKPDKDTQKRKLKTNFFDNINAKILSKIQTKFNNALKKVIHDEQVGFIPGCKDSRT
jgi:hypothetical protein